MQKALEAEFYADRRRGVNDAFVTEIPLLCSKVYSGAGPVITAARVRGHTADLAAGWDCTRRADQQNAMQVVRNRLAMWSLHSIAKPDGSKGQTGTGTGEFFAIGQICG